MYFDITLLGYGISNQATLKCFLQKEAGKAFVSSTATFSDDDIRFFSQNGVEWEETRNSDKCLDTRRVVISPGIPPSHPIVREMIQKGIPILTDIDYAYSFFPSHLKNIGITGTNGKTTTVELLTHLLSQKYRATSAGNIGMPPAEWVLQGILSDLDYMVFELSSFQLFYMKSNFLDVSALLNISVDHMSWHETIDNYVQAKYRIFEIKKAESGSQGNFIHADLVSPLHPLSAYMPKHTEITYDYRIGYETSADGVIDPKSEPPLFSMEHGSKTLSFGKLKIKGIHNLENAAFASSIANFFHLPLSSIDAALASFRPSDHRLEEFLEYKGVRYVNDSKSTNADALLKALSTFKRKEVGQNNAQEGRLLLLAGGRGKGEDYHLLADEIVRECAKVYYCGENSALLFPLLKGRMDCVLFDNWEDAIRSCVSEVQTGDIVLFSPGGSSFDFFKNYLHRGEFFKSTIHQLLGI